MKARKAWNEIQKILGTRVDNGIPGPTDQRALTDLHDAARANGEWPIEPIPTPPISQWHEGKASSFADPADIKAFRRCKAQGKSDQECFKVGDNGVGCWGDDTSEGSGPSCALPPDDMIEGWGSIEGAKHAGVLVEVRGKIVKLVLKDRMPWKTNITNGAAIDLNPDAAALLGLEPPFLVSARWKWASA